MPIGLWAVVIVAACFFSFLSKMRDSNKELAELAKTPSDVVGADFTLHACLSIVVAFVVGISLIWCIFITPFILNAK